jgi:hypothetical protein
MWVKWDFWMCKSLLEGAVKGINEINGASRVRNVILGCGLAENWREICTRSIWKGKYNFPRGRIDQGGPRDHFRMEIRRKRVGKTGCMDILGMAKTCEFSGKIILHAGLPPGVPEINEALDISRKIFWKLDGGIEGVTENAEIPGAENAIVLPVHGTPGVHAAKSDMEMDENCAGMASEKDTMS